MNKVQYNVNGLLNNQIRTQVKNALNDLDGVQKVNVDLGRSSIEVGFNNATSEQEIRNGIEHVGCHIFDSSAANSNYRQTCCHSFQ